jgi:septal ring factor EnvC (AmiA/AmiB activator)
VALALALVLGAPAAAADDAPARRAIARQLADELAAIERAQEQVGGKLAVLDAARGRQLAAGYRLLAAPAPDPHTAARRRAALRLVLERGLAERRLLAREAAQLAAAATDRRELAARVLGLALPTELGRPARGRIARRFGALAHERSRTTLSRRGIDLEVDERAPALAPADGAVRYAGPIRGLDEGVILDHGSYVTVIAKLGATAAPLGAAVRRGDRIGRAARQRIYFEVRAKLGAGGVPIDPEPLLAAASEPR